MLDEYRHTPGGLGKNIDISILGGFLCLGIA
jgi:hypothetical protein